MNTPLVLDPNGNLIDSEDVRQLARTYTPAAIGALAELINSENESAAVAACSALLAYGHGRPTQTINAEVKHTVDVGSFERIAAKLEHALAAAETAEANTLQ
jgi:hypothetical protein